MTGNQEIIKLYTELANNPKKDFGWEKGLENAKAHGYKEEWIEKIPTRIWDYCAAVGNPFRDAEIKEGDTVLDLGCGAGVDLLVASLLVGERGKVYGVDITPKMVQTATEHAQLIGASNVKVVQGSFDDTGLEDESVDVVISNGAINLTSCKESVFAEIYRVLEPNGKLYFADMIDTSIDEGSCCSGEQSSCCSSGEEDWANCVAGTMREQQLIELIQEAGFKDVSCTGYTHYKTAKTTQGATFQAIKISAEVLRQKHWDAVFQKVDYTQVLWHQNSPQKSLDFIEKYATKESKIIDVGCGASLLVDALLEKDYKNITLLDTSKVALDIVKNRLKTDIQINYSCKDILQFKPQSSYDIWHDRAVYHFLLTRKEQEQYFQVLANALRLGGIAIISTFRVEGPTQCSGLDIMQYDADRLQTLLPPELQLSSFEEYLHITPKNTDQKYIYFILNKV